MTSPMPSVSPAIPFAGQPTAGATSATVSGQADSSGDSFMALIQAALSAGAIPLPAAPPVPAPPSPVPAALPELAATPPPALLLTPSVPADTEPAPVEEAAGTEAAQSPGGGPDLAELAQPASATPPSGAPRPEVPAPAGGETREPLPVDARPLPAREEVSRLIISPASPRPANLLGPASDEPALPPEASDVSPVIRPVVDLDRQPVEPHAGARAEGPAPAVAGLTAGPDRPAPAHHEPPPRGEGAREAAGPARPLHEQLGDGIVTNARLVERGRGTDFILELHPPELGKVHVVLQSTQEGLTARLLVADEGARQLVESQLAQLRQRLNESACPVIRCSVGDMGGQSHSRQQQGWQQPQQPPGPWRLPAVVAISTTAGIDRDRLDVVA